ncbi:MAG: MerR family transcriptional regulator [Bacteroidota bacterium]
MKKYKVKELAALAGVSIRTLHYYDKMGLLKPFNRSDVGYRYYGEKELLRLQQILFYKELDFPLKRIKELLKDADFDLLAALENHRIALTQRKERINILLTTIDDTIHHLKTATIMKNPADLYRGLSKEMGTTYRQEAIDEWGKTTVEQSEKDLLKLGKAGFDSLKKEMALVTQALFEKRNDNPESEPVQRLIAQHYQIICQFWGTSVKKDQQRTIYGNLGELYVSDDRYMAKDGLARPEFALFMQEAMKYFANELES